MTLAAAVIGCGLGALLFVLLSTRAARRRHGVIAGVHGVVAAAWLLAAVLVALVGVDLASYARLTHEEPVAEVRFRKTGERRFDASILYPDQRRESFDLAGDEWQLDARVLKWHGVATLLGLDTVFRLDRIGGRYTRIEDERIEPRTVYELARPPGLDLWTVARHYPRWLPWVDALYGRATYLPMADGAHFAVSVSASGLVGRPQNREAREAVAAWH
jgi:hypothetical protein